MEALSAEAVSIGEIMVEEFTSSSGSALGVPAAPVPHMMALGENGSLMVYKVGGGVNR